MSKFKSALRFDTTKSFEQAIIFYIFHVILAALVSVVFTLTILELFTQDVYTYINGGLTTLVMTRIIRTLYLLALSFMILKRSGYRLFYVNLLLLGALITYVLSPLLGFLFPAYVTTLGRKNSSDVNVI